MTCCGLKTSMNQTKDIQVTSWNISICTIEHVVDCEVATLCYSPLFIKWLVVNGGMLSRQCGLVGTLINYARVQLAWAHTILLR